MNASIKQPKQPHIATIDHTPRRRKLIRFRPGKSPEVLGLPLFPDTGAPSLLGLLLGRRQPNHHKDAMEDFK